MVARHELSKRMEHDMPILDLIRERDAGDEATRVNIDARVHWPYGPTRTSREEAA